MNAHSKTLSLLLLILLPLNASAIVVGGAVDITVPAGFTFFPTNSHNPGLGPWLIGLPDGQTMQITMDDSSITFDLGTPPVETYSFTNGLFTFQGVAGGNNQAPNHDFTNYDFGSSTNVTGFDPVTDITTTGVSNGFFSIDLTGVTFSKPSGQLVIIVPEPVAVAYMGIFLAIHRVIQKRRRYWVRNK